MTNFHTNALYYGDCLDWMGKWNDQSVDLIYLDPPFNSNANYNVLYATEKMVRRNIAHLLIRGSGMKRRPKGMSNIYLQQDAWHIRPSRVYITY